MFLCPHPVAKFGRPFSPINTARGQVGVFIGRGSKPWITGWMRTATDGKGWDKRDSRGSVVTTPPRQVPLAHTRRTYLKSFGSSPNGLSSSVATASNRTKPMVTRKTKKQCATKPLFSFKRTNGIANAYRNKNVFAI